MGKLSANILEDSTALLIPFKGNALEWFPGVRANLVGSADSAMHGGNRLHCTAENQLPIQNL